MAAATICSDFGAPKIKSVTVSIVSTSISHEVMGPGSPPNSSVYKESAYDAGDPSSIFGSGRSPGEGIGYPLHYSWASLVVQLVMNLPALWETWL